jgi:hypothetical protein
MTQYTVPKKKAHFFEATVRRAVSNRSLSLGFVGRVDERVEVRFWRASSVDGHSRRTAGQRRRSARARARARIGVSANLWN